MKKKFTSIVCGLFISTSSSAQVTLDFNSGAVSDWLLPTPAPIFALSSSQGMQGSGALTPQSTPYTINYFNQPSADFAVSGAVLTMSAMFQVAQPTSNATGTRTFELGYASSQSPSSFISPYHSSTVYWSLYPYSPSTTGWDFRQSLGLSVYNGSTNAGFSSSGAAFSLQANNWYMIRCSLERIDETTIRLSSFIDDYGTSGSSFVASVDSSSFRDTGTFFYPFSIIAQDSTLYPALHGMSSGGLVAVDNITLTAIPEPQSAALATGIAGIALALTWRRKRSKSEDYVARQCPL